MDDRSLSPVDSVRISDSAPATPLVANSSAADATRSLRLVATPLGFGMEFGGDLAVISVKRDSQAARSGAKLGDVVRAVNGLAVGSLEELQTALAAVPIGSTVVLDVVAEQVADSPLSSSETRV